MNRSKPPRKVNGRPILLHMVNYLGAEAEDRVAMRTLFEKMIVALDKAGFKYQRAHARYGSLVSETLYKGTPVRFVVSSTRHGFEGYVLLPGHKIRTAGIVLVGSKVNVIMDMVDEIPSMTLDL